MDENKNNNSSIDPVGGDGKKQVSAADLRYAAWFVLVVAAIFVINAMETGSYRTPWPVAILVSIAGLGLLGYSFVMDRREVGRDN